MSLMSMTGRGVAAAAGRLARVEVELSSVNRKQLDIDVGLPRSLGGFESRVQTRVQARLSRGLVTGEIRVTWTEAAQAAGVRVDLGLARAAIDALRAAAKKTGLPDDLKASALLALPGLVSQAHGERDLEAVWPTVQKALDAALAKLQAMRRKEGAALGRDLRARLAALRKLVAEITARAPAVAATYRANLLKRIGEALPGSDLAADERDDAAVRLAEAEIAGHGERPLAPHRGADVELAVRLRRRVGGRVLRRRADPSRGRGGGDDLPRRTVPLEFQRDDRFLLRHLLQGGGEEQGAGRRAPERGGHRRRGGVHRAQLLGDFGRLDGDDPRAPFGGDCPQHPIHLRRPRLSRVRRRAMIMDGERLGATAAAKGAVDAPRQAPST